MRQTTFLVEPDYPLPAKSKNHFRWLPLPLLKMATYFKQRGDVVYLIRGCNGTIGAHPDRIFVTSLFTYWSGYVADAIAFYKTLYPAVPLTLGGIYATLASCGKPNGEKDCATCQDHCHPRQSGADEIWIGDWPEVDACAPDYSLVDGVDYQIIQNSKGCVHRCKFCANHRLSPWQWSSELPEELWANKLVFYDPAFIDNPAIRDILEQIAAARPNGRVVRCDAQSGFSKARLAAEPDIAFLLKKARFISPRIAWDGGLKEFRTLVEAIEVLQAAGFRRREIQVFIISNWRMPFEHLEEKRRWCSELQVQIADCRFRPLDGPQSLFDRYNPWAKSQGPEDYYIDDGWTDQQIRAFRRNCRSQNIALRFGVTVEAYNAWRRAGGQPRGTGRSHRNYPVEQSVQMTFDLGNTTKGAPN